MFVITLIFGSHCIGCSSNAIPYSNLQALASTRVVIVPCANGPNDSVVMDAQSSVLKEKKFSGSGSDTDIITSSARAYTSALNKLLSWHIRRSSNLSDNDTSGTGDAVAVNGEAPSVVSA